MTDFCVEFSWVPENVGGHQGPPYEGMRTTIRWQKYVAEHLKLAVDTQWTELDFDPDSRQGTARCTLSERVTVPEDWLVEGELVEFLNGFRVLAIGKIKPAKQS